MVLFFGLNHKEKYCTKSTVILHRLYCLESCQIVLQLFNVKILQTFPVIFLHSTKNLHNLPNGNFCLKFLLYSTGHFPPTPLPLSLLCLINELKTIFFPQSV